MNMQYQIFHNFILQVMLNLDTVLRPSGKIGGTTPAPH
jgi:hypothetical protein